MNKENWMKEYESGKVKECPFCGSENLQHFCRNCYSDINKEICWKYKSYCKKCFIHINEEIPQIEVLKKELGVECKCSDSNCGKCLISCCVDNNCPVHTVELKRNRQKTYGK